jgi:hypothetical protein
VVTPCGRPVVSSISQRMIRSGATEANARYKTFTGIHRTDPEQSQAAWFAHTGPTGHGIEPVRGRPEGPAPDPHNNNGELSLPSRLLLSRPVHQWSAAERLLALHESHGLHAAALHA